MLAARASHVTNCLRFRLAQRYLPGVNQRALTQTMVPDTLFARPNNRHNHVHHWSLETTNFQFVFKRFFFTLIPLITVQSNLVVTCTTSCTCHHETDLAWVNSFNCNICFKHKTDESCQTRQFRGLNIDCENHVLWFAPHTFIFPLNICQMVICPVRGT